MTIRNICLLSILGMLLTFTFTGKPSDAQSIHEFKIHVDVTSNDENTKSLVQSWIKREFRGLGDVRIVSFDDASYILSLVVVEPVYEATGRKTGSIAIAREFALRSFTNPHLYHRSHLGLQTGNTENLERLCKKLVAGIDTDNLESVRELFQ